MNISIPHQQQICIDKVLGVIAIFPKFNKRTIKVKDQNYFKFLANFFHWDVVFPIRERTGDENFLGSKRPSKSCIYDIFLIFVLEINKILEK